MWFRIIFTFISFLIVVFASAITFFVNEKSDFKKFDLAIPKDWFYYVEKTDKSWFIEREWNTSLSGTILYENFNVIDKIFFQNNNSYKRESLVSEEKINLYKWKYFLFLWLNKKYVVTWSWFNINLIWPAKIYIDTDNIKTTIFSIDNKLDISLLWLDDLKEKTKVYLYPHTYISFKPYLNRILGNADLLRLSQVNDINYFKKSIYIDEVNYEDHKDLDNDFFKTFVKYYYNWQQVILNKKISLNSSLDISSYDKLKKYFSFFVNKTKKISYYKDLIYINLINIYKNDYNDSSFQDLILYFNDLKSLDTSSYEEMVGYLNYFKYIYTYEFDLSTKNLEKKIKYDDVYWKILWYKQLESDYILYSIFNLYDIWEKNNFFDWIISFSTDYLWTTWVKLGDSKITWYKDSKNIELWYYIVFLENIIKSNLSEKLITGDIKYIFDIFNKYSLLSSNIYSTLDDNKKKTSIVLQLELLKSLNDFFKKTFFEEELENWIVLVKKKWYDLDVKYFVTFENSFKNLVNFFENNKSLFDQTLEKDSLYINDYLSIITKFDDYISALKDYKNYKLKKSESWNIETIGLDNDKIVYTLDIIDKYLSGFNWLNNDSYKITTTDNKVFDIKMILGWKLITFDLYPYESFYLRNLYIDWIKKDSYTYNLSDIKKKMDELYKSTSDPKNRDKYNFSNFFINTFLIVDSFWNQVTTFWTNWSNQNIKEDTYILVFKRDKLLWIKGEFNILKDFTELNSENIIITDNYWKYDIKLKDMKVFFSYTNWTNNYTNWAYISSDYILDDKSHYFTNIKLKIYKNIQLRTWLWENLWLWDTNIQVSWNIDIRDFKDYMYDILKYYDSIVIVNNLLQQKSNKIYIIIDKNKVIKYSFIYNSKNFEFYLNKDNIVSIKVDFKEKIKEPFNYNLLQDYINLLVK